MRDVSKLFSLAAGRSLLTVANWAPRTAHEAGKLGSVTVRVSCAANRGKHTARSAAQTAAVRFNETTNMAPLQRIGIVQLLPQRRTRRIRTYAILRPGRPDVNRFPLKIPFSVAISRLRVELQFVLRTDSIVARMT